MEFRRLGASGFNVPVLSFGAGTFGGVEKLFVPVTVSLPERCTTALSFAFPATAVFTYWIDAAGTAVPTMTGRPKARRGSITMLFGASARRSSGKRRVSSRGWVLVRGEASQP